MPGELLFDEWSAAWHPIVCSLTPPLVLAGAELAAVGTPAARKAGVGWARRPSWWPGKRPARFVWRVGPRRLV
jgi:hypothetical protein